MKSFFKSKIALEGDTVDQLEASTPQPIGDTPLEAAPAADTPVAETPAPAVVPAADPSSVADVPAVVEAVAQAVAADVEPAVVVEVVEAAVNAACTAPEGEAAAAAAEAAQAAAAPVTPDAEPAPAAEAPVEEEGEVVPTEGLSEIPPADLSVASPEAEDEIEDEIAVAGEGEMIGEAADAELAHSEGVETEVVLESLTILAGEIESLISSGKYNSQTATLVKLAANQQLARVGGKLPSLSLESGTPSVLLEHQLALEGVRDMINRLKQAYVVSWKRLGHLVFGESNAPGLSAKYGKVLENGLAEFNAKKGSFKDTQHTGSLADVWQFFSTGAGSTANVAEALKKDLAFNEYLMITWPKQVIELLRKYEAIVKSAKVDSVEGVTKMVEAVAKLPRPISLFDKKLLVAGRPLLGAAGLEVNYGPTRSTVSIAGKAFPDLAKLASSVQVRESSSIGHTLKRVGNEAAGYSKFFGKTIKYSTADIGTVLQSGQQYIANVEAYIELFRELDKAVDPIERQLSLLAHTHNNAVSDGKLKGTAPAFNQVYDAGVRIVDAFHFSGKPELVRALRGARYCSYLGLRMIANAK